MKGKETQFMSEFYKRMNVPNNSKQKVANYILKDFNKKDTLVLDLGCGTGVIDQLLLDGGFRGDIIAIDKNDECRIESKRFEFVHSDLFFGLGYKLIKIKTYKKVVVVLSAILHELDNLKLLSQIIKSFGVETHLIIREPVITDTLVQNDFEIVWTDKFMDYLKLHRNWPTKIAFINFCFIEAYGNDSWDREKHEGRFTFDFKDIMLFIQDCGCSLDKTEFEKDDFYKEKLPYNMYEKIGYTGTLMVCGRNWNERMSLASKQDETKNKEKSSKS